MTGSRSNGSSATIGIQNLARSRAVQTGYNQSKVGSGAFLSYRFGESAYAVVESDTTPPSRPVVTDGGAITGDGTQLFAAWTSTDAESGIREYQYAIGKTPGAADVRGFTATAQTSVTATGLTLQAGSTYYFAVRAVNGSNLTSEIGVSDGIRFDPSFQPEVKIIPSAPQSALEFTGIALYAPSPATVVLKALDSSGNLIAGAGVQNPQTVSLTAGQQYARLVQELFGLSNFDGWIEMESSASGLGVYTATGSWNLLRMDGSVSRENSADFFAFHPGATLFLVNPSVRTATVTVSEIGTSNTRALSIPPRSKISTVITGLSRIQSSEPLAAIERFGGSAKLGIGTTVPVTSAQSSLVFPNGVTGLGYATTLAVANVIGQPVDTTISFAGFSRTLRLEPNTVRRISLSDFLQIPVSEIRSGAVRVAVAATVFGAPQALAGVLDIENVDEVVSLGARPPATESLFVHVAHGDGLFTGLAIATGSAPATVTIEVYSSAGGNPKSATLTLGANEQIAKLVSELVPAVVTQMGGYIRIRSDKPIWTWEIYGSSRIMASGPPI